MTNCLHDHSRWGDGDQTGAAGHLLDQTTTLSALRKIQSGEIIDLSHTIEMGAHASQSNSLYNFLVCNCQKQYENTRKAGRKK